MIKDKREALIHCFQLKIKLKYNNFNKINSFNNKLLLIKKNKINIKINLKM